MRIGYPNIISFGCSTIIYAYHEVDIYKMPILERSKIQDDHCGHYIASNEFSRASY